MGRNPEDDWMFDPALAAMNRQLSREFRDEAREVEHEVAASERRSQSFADLALEARNRGDEIVLATQRRSFQGFLQFASKDFVTLENVQYIADINLSAVDYLRPVRNGRQAGRATMPSSGTFEMRLLERESPTERVEIGWLNREETLLGRISSVGQDQITVIDDQRNPWIIPTDSVAFVVRKPIQRRMA